MPELLLPDQINCVRWSPNGDMIAIASTNFDSDENVALLDFKTGKTLYTGEASDCGNLLLLDNEQWF